MAFTEDQKKAINSYGQDVLISASAGSGKTSTMMAKIGEMVTCNAEGIDNKFVDVRNLMIVTFTKAVAKELKEKIINKILEEIKKSPESNYELLKSQIENIPLANISTIHSMCSSIIRQYFSEADVDPSFKVIEDNEADILLNRAINNVQRAKVLENNNEYSVIYGYFDKKLPDNIKTTYKKIRSMENYKEYLETAKSDIYDNGIKNSKLYKDYISMQRAILCKEIENINKGIDILNKEDTVFFASKIEKFYEARDIVNSIINTKNDDDFCKAVSGSILSRKPTFSNKPEKQNILNGAWGYVDHVKEKIKAIKKLITMDTAFAKEDSVILKEYISIINDVDNEYAKIKNTENALDFNDLEHKMMQLLNNKSVVDELSDRFKYIFVDEYQDINPLQEAILQKISNNQNNLFMIGDVKQSIYRFRMADPTIFINKYREFNQDKEKGKAINFNVNFRSRKEILDFANIIFDVIMTEDLGGVDYKNTARLAPPEGKELEVLEPSKHIKIAFIEDNKDETKVSNLSEDKIYSVKYDNNVRNINKLDKEGLYISKEIKKIVNKLVLSNGKVVGYDDIAIIGRRKKDIMAVIKTLEKCGIPVDSSNVSKDTKNEDIQLLISLLSLIDNQKQDIELATVMSSVFGGFSLSELATIKADCGYTQFFYEAVRKYEDDNKLKSKIEKFNNMLSRYNFMSKYTSVDKLLEIIISENNYDEYVLSKRDGNKSLSQIRVFVNSIRGKSYSSSIAKFLYIYREFPELENTDSSSQVSKKCISSMTIHGSKGLEFPIVFIVGATENFNKDDGKQDVFISKEYGVAIKHANPQTRIKDSSMATQMLAFSNNRGQFEEEMRLLYVAITRAKEYLYITGKKGKKGQIISADDAKSYYDWIGLVANTIPNFENTYFDISADNIEENIEEKNLETNISLKYAENDIYDKLVNSMKESYYHIESTKNAISYSVTALNKDSYIAEEQQKISNVLAKKFDYKTTKTAKEGTAYHKVMELISFDCHTIADVEAEIDNMVENNQLSEEQRKLVKASDIFECLQNPLMKLVDKNTVRQEQQFKILIPAKEVLLDTTIEDKVMVQGVIDMFIPKTDRNPNILIDFKYSNESEDEIRKIYKTQIDLYTKALEICLNEKVEEKYIYVLGANKVVKF